MGSRKYTPRYESSRSDVRRDGVQPGQVLPATTPRLRFREMTKADRPAIATLEIGTSRDPAGWIAWNRQNYREHGFGLWVIETHVGELGVEHLIAIIRPDNVASQAVATKIGLTLERRVIKHGGPALIFGAGGGD